jgi:hypothetical protein
MSTKTCPFKVGDVVGYKSCLEDPEFTHVGRVYDVWIDGIPSDRRPLIKIEGKAGVIDPDHCTKIPRRADPPQRLVDALAALSGPEETLLGINPGPEETELQEAWAEYRAMEAVQP